MCVGRYVVKRKWNMLGFLCFKHKIYELLKIKMRNVSLLNKQIKIFENEIHNKKKKVRERSMNLFQKHVNRSNVCE